jgi:cytoskeletal protein RodZ
MLHPCLIDKMQTKKTHDKTLFILMGVGAGILLLAALGLFLVQGLNEPQPGDELTPTGALSTSTATQTQTATSTGTRRPTRTPKLITDTPGPTQTSAPANSPTAMPTENPTANPTATQPAPSATSAPANTATATQAPAQPSATQTPLPPTATNTPEPTATGAATAYLSPTPLETAILISGRVVNQDTPIENVTIILEITLEQNDVVELVTTTASDGTYQFQSTWKNKAFDITFSLESNSQLEPASDYVTWTWFEGTILGNIEAPDLEISAKPNGDLFEQSLPSDGSSFSAAQITFETPLTFEWTGYPQAEQYWVDLGRQGEENPAWSSIPLIDVYVDFNGTLSNPPQTKISEGTYWWAVGTLRKVLGFNIYVYTHNWTLVITP